MEKRNVRHVRNIAYDESLFDIFTRTIWFKLLFDYYTIRSSVWLNMFHMTVNALNQVHNSKVIIDNGTGLRLTNCDCFTCKHSVDREYCVKCMIDKQIMQFDDTCDLWESKYD